MRSTPNRDVKRNWDKHHPAANTAAIVTLAATAGTYHSVEQVLFSYDDDPTGGSLTLSTTGRDDIVLSVPFKGARGVVIEHGFSGDIGAAMTITLAAAGAACTGKLNVQSK